MKRAFNLTCLFEREKANSKYTKKRLRIIEELRVKTNMLIYRSYYYQLDRRSHDAFIQGTSLVGTTMHSLLFCGILIIILPSTNTAVPWCIPCIVYLMYPRFSCCSSWWSISNRSVGIENGYFGRYNQYQRDHWS